MNCERCGAGTSGYELHDYCRSCGKNLCAADMKRGCCGWVPALSGMEQDDAEPTSPVVKVLVGPSGAAPRGLGRAPRGEGRSFKGGSGSTRGSRR